MTSVPYESKVSPAPKVQRLNVRLILFLLVVSAPFAWVLFSAVRTAMSGGVIDRGDHQEVNLKALGNFPFDGTAGQLSNIPQRFRDLDGKRVSMKGYVYSPDSAGARGNRFQFVYDVNKCCFSGPPQVQERVFAYAKDSIALPPDYSVFCEVTGVMHVRIQKTDKDGPISSVYDLDVESLTQVN